MQRNQKIIVTSLWGVAVLAMLGVVGTGLWARRTSGLEVLYDAPRFSLTDQAGQNITENSLRGKVWIAAIFFSQCPDVCPMMMGRMMALQKAVPSPDVKIVSFTIDPEHDTPEVLAKYADRIGADQTRWHFLTGSKETMLDVANSGLKLAAVAPQQGQPAVHAQKVLLIDRANRVRGIYASNDEESMKKLAADAQALAADDVGGGL